MEEEKNRNLQMLPRTPWEYLALFAVFLVLSFLQDEGFFPLFFFIFLVFLIKTQKIRWGVLLKFLTIPILFIVFGLLGIVIVLGANQPDTIWVLADDDMISLSVTQQSLEEATKVWWRTMNTLLSFYAVWGVADREEFQQLCKILKIPRDLVEMGMLSYRYIQVLRMKAQEVRSAQRLRLGYTSLRRSIKSFAQLLAAVFLYGTYVFQQNHQALVCRGYSGQLYYSDAVKVQNTRWWWLLIVGCFLLLGFI